MIDILAVVRPSTSLTTSFKADQMGQVQASKAYGKLPLSFEPNHGQANDHVKFLSRGSGYHLFLTSTEMVLSLSKPRTHEPDQQSPAAHRDRGKKQDATQEVMADRFTKQPRDELRIKLVGGSTTPHIDGLDELPGKVNYFIGNDPRKWCTDIPTYARVRYREVYPGVTLIYYGNQRQLEYDFIVASGANPGAITLAFSGMRKLSIDDQGNLVLHTGGGEIRQHKPLIYQEINHVKHIVPGRYVLKGKYQVGFEVDAYDPAAPLIIDPTLSYSTYFGGSGDDDGRSIAVDSDGNVYLTGSTDSIDFNTKNPLQPSRAGNKDAFVAKLNAEGNGLVYSTYLGGSGDDNGFSIAVDSAGNAYVAGSTDSTDFNTKDPLQRNSAGNRDAFVAKLNAAGNSLTYSTYLGGGGDDDGFGIAVDRSGNAYVMGSTDSTDFNIRNPLQRNNAGGKDAFVAKLNAAGSSLVYSTYLGGSGDDNGFSIAVDSAGSAYLTGSTDSIDFDTKNPLQEENAGGKDAFIAKLNATGNSLVYSTYLGGSNDEDSFSITVNSAGNAYVTGSTDSADFNTKDPLQQENAGGRDALVAKLNAAGSDFVYSTYLGGGGDDDGFSITVDSTENAYVTGSTTSTDFNTKNPLQEENAGGKDAFVARLNAEGNDLIYSTYLGGSGDDDGFGIAVDRSGYAYVTGSTNSTDFNTKNPFQRDNAGSKDAFVAKIGPDLTTTTVSSSVNPSVFGQPVTFTAAVAGITPDSGTPTGAVVFKDGTTTIGTVALNPSGQATLITSSLSAGSHSITAEYGGDSDFRASKSPALTQTVNKAATATAVSSSTNPSVSGQSVTFTAQVSIIAPGSGTPTGAITFRDGATTLGTGALNAAGRATLTTSSLSAGSHPITAEYGGNSNFNASASPALMQTVNAAADLAITMAASPSPVVAGANITYTITVANNGPNAATAMTVTDNLPATTTFVSCTATGGVCGGSGNNRTVTFASLAAGASATISFVAIVNPSVAGGAVISNTATVSYPGDPNLANNSATVTTTTLAGFIAAGRVTTPAGAAISGVTLTHSLVSGTGYVPAAAQTDANGNWTRSGFQAGVTYRVTPSKPGYNFTPSFLDVSGARNDMNFAGAFATTTVSAASYQTTVTPEAIAAAFDTSLATTTQAAATLPLPTSLAGTTVKIRDSAGGERLAPLFFVAPTQVNFQIPPGTVSGQATVTVTSGDGTVSSGAVNIATVAPGLFSANASGQGVAAAAALRVKADGTQVYEPVARFDAAQNRFVAAPIDLGPESDQVFLLLFGTGLRLRNSLSSASLSIGGINAEVLYAGAQGDFVGLDQVNLRLPRSLAGRGEVDVALTVDGKVANTVKVSVK